MNKPVDYQSKREELDKILAWFESGEANIDEAIEKYKQAEKIITELETYLSDQKAKIDEMVKKVKT